MIPFVGPLVADMLDPVVRLMVEAGYDRTISPGVPTSSNLLYSPDPTVLAGNISVAFATGLDNVLQDIGMGRVQGTARPDIGPGSTGQGAYGIGSPPVTMDPTDNELDAASFQQPAPAVGPTAAAAERERWISRWLEHCSRQAMALRADGWHSCGRRNRRRQRRQRRRRGHSRH